eukprot:TRINITY_DN787_c0_g1_i1.p1 TRINITY_DN787_c0_g1~~TRINITY_DN787_c0_g1_i1.p1  ORF type:complete len:231 (+),score=60.66 TRINITY_DN787_c0_g1_i1:276-968(+)
MSSLRNAVKRRTHKERAQPSARSKFGLLEKHKDYVARAQDYHKKEEVIRRLQEKAAFKNPDEFYFKMINSKTIDGVHRPKGKGNQYSKDELLSIETQNIGYWLQKAQSEKKKVERLTSSLHSTNCLPSAKHVYFAEDSEEAMNMSKGLASAGESSTASTWLPKHIARKVAGAYKELEQRKKRAAELQNIVVKYSLQKELMGKGRKRKLHDDEINIPMSEPVYKWRKERKR